MNYFVNCKTVESVKVLYRTLAKKMHPDKGGSAEDFRALNEEYLSKLASLDGQKSFDEESGKEYTYNYNEEVEKEILSKIKDILSLGVEVTMIGTWLWILGDTKRVKEQLKGLGCRWHSKRVCWYWRPASYKAHRTSKGSLSSLAMKYGVTEFTQNGLATV